LEEPELDYIFVYGTLRKDLFPNRNELLADRCVFFCKGTFQGLLFEIDGYPGAIESTNRSDQVVGEIYQTRTINRVLKKLDDYEQCSVTHPQPHEYCRKHLPIKTQSQQVLKAWIYVYNRPVIKRTKIESGDYQDFIAVHD